MVSEIEFIMSLGGGVAQMVINANLEQYQSLKNQLYSALGSSTNMKEDHLICSNPVFALKRTYF